MAEFNSEKFYEALEAIRQEGESEITDNSVRDYVSNLKKAGLISYDQLREYHNYLVEQLGRPLTSELEKIVKENGIEVEKPIGDKATSEELLGGIEEYVAKLKEGITEIREKIEFLGVSGFDDLPEKLLNEIRYLHGESVENILRPIVIDIMRNYKLDISEITAKADDLLEREAEYTKSTTH